MSESLKVLRRAYAARDAAKAAERTAKETYDLGERGVKATYRGGKKVHEAGSKVVRATGKAVFEDNKAGRAVKRGAIRTADAVAGKKKGVRAAAVYGAIPIVYMAHLGAKKGTKGAALAGSAAGSKTGFALGTLTGIPGAGLGGSMIGSSLGAAASQTRAGRYVGGKAVEGAQYVGRKAKSAGRYVKGKAQQKVRELKQDIHAGTAAAGARALRADLGGKKGGKLKSFRRGMKASKAVREGSRDLAVLRRAYAARQAAKNS